jgi:UDP:flavonoid glycosyltransferase YjiC (YdhE family)
MITTLGRLRVLFSCVGGEGHFHPLTPLARAFADDGHEVAFATAPSQRERAEAAGFAFHAAGIEPGERLARAGAHRAEILELPPDERRAFIYPLLFGSIDAPAKIDELRSIVSTWRPDLVVHDSCDLAAPLAAAERDLPSVHHSFGRMVPPAIVAGAGPVTEPLWRAAGLAPEPYAGMFRGIYVDIAPPSFQTETVPAGVRVEPLRSASLDAPATERAPNWLEHLPDRPTVYATLGTVHNDLSVFRLLLEAFAEVDCNVIATIGRNKDPAELAPIPDNARVERYISQALILPHASVVVSHGGSGSTLAALAHGLPILFVPQGADQFENAAQVQALGAGVRLMPNELTVSSARAGLESILADASFRERARDVAEEIASMPDPSALVPVLVDAARQ